MIDEDRAVPELWLGMLDLYSAPGVPEACVTVQDACDTDVLLLLTAALLARSEIQLTPALAGRLIAETLEWHREVVMPLRSLRRQWRGRTAAEALRERVKALELDAERMEVAILQSVLDEAPLQPRAPADMQLLLHNCHALLPVGPAGAACIDAQVNFGNTVAAYIWAQTGPRTRS